MARSRGGKTAPIILALTIIGALVFAGGGAASAQDDAATDQRVVRLVGDYVVDAAGGAVDVTEEITVSNVRGSTRSGNTITSYFWTGHTIWAPTDAQDLSISVDGEELEWEVADTISGIDIISADYRRNLNFGQTRVIDVSYTLPTYAPDLGARRINEAFFDFELIICCGFEEVDLTVVIPSRFDVTPSNALRFESTPGQTVQSFTFSDNEVTGQFTELLFTDWSGFNEAGMERSTAPVGDGGSEVELVYPPDDQAWAVTATTDLTDLGGVLEELVGVPFPNQSTVLRQGPNPDFDVWGVTGGADQAAEPDDVLILPRDYDQRGLAATLALAWMSEDSTFTDGVVREGLAYEFASEAIARTGGSPADPDQPGGGAALSPEGRQWVIRQVADEIGYDGLTELLAMARDGETAYEGEGEVEQSATIPADWRRFVDLAERRLGSEQVVPVFTDHVLDGAGLAMLDERADTLDDYEELEQAADGVMPLGIRDAMTNWEFEQAGTLLTTAQDVIDERERIIEADAERADDADLALGETWADARSVEDLEAVQAGLLDRENELERGQLIRLILIGLGALLLVALVVGALLFRRRRAAAGAGGQAEPVIDLTDGGAGASGPWAQPPAGGFAAPVAAPPVPEAGAPAPVPSAPGFAVPTIPPSGPPPGPAPAVAPSPGVISTPDGIPAPAGTPTANPVPAAQDPRTWAPPTATAAPSDATVEVAVPDLPPPVAAAPDEEDAGGPDPEGLDTADGTEST